jgi:hypothetical protein
MCYGVGQDCDNNNNQQLVSSSTTLYYNVYSGWWWCENTITSTPHQINKQPTSRESGNLFLLFVNSNFLIMYFFYHWFINDLFLISSC